MVTSLAVAAFLVVGAACVTADHSVTGPPSTSPTTIPARCRTDFVALGLAIEKFRKGSGRYPNSLAELKALKLVDAAFNTYDFRPRRVPGTPPEIVPAPGGGCPARPTGPALRESKAREAACDTDFTVLTGALGAYELVKGSKATTMQQLVAAGLLASPSELHKITPDGKVVPLPGSLCPE